MSSFSKNTSSCSEDDVELRRGPWTLEEDTLLVHFVARHGEGRWNLLAKRAGLRRTGKSCRLRWLNYLKPDVKRGNLTPQEQLLILELHSKWGNRWSKIAQHLPGRTDNEIKNYWRTRVQKQARHLKIDANSKAFQEVIRCFWMPRLIQKIEGSSSCPDGLTQNPANLPQPVNHVLAPSAVSQSHLDQTSEKLQSLDLHEQNSDSEHCTSSCISSAESMNISQISQFSEYPTSPFHALSGDHYNTFAKNCYYVDNTGYDIEAIVNLASSTSGLMDSGNPNPVAGYHVANGNWVDDGLTDGVWNIDDQLWPLRNLQERRI